MCRHLAFLFLLINGSVLAQDSIRVKRLGLYDCTLFAAFDFIQNESRVNLPYIQSFTENQGHAFDNLAFPDTVSYALYADPHGETDGGEFGLSFTFHFIKPEKEIFRRLKPRVDFFYSYKQFFTYNVNLTRRTILDTLGDPSNNYILRDSVQSRHLTYSYYTEQLFLQLGFNYEVINRRYFNVYSGILFSEGVSFQNEFTSESYDSFRIDQISSQGHQHKGEETTSGKKVLATDESISHSFRLSTPIGLQYRFNPAKGFSMGFTVEGRLGVEQYVIDKGRSVTHLLFAFGAGLRFSFYSHREEG